ncbi:cystatin cpi-1-like [Cotesia typhae]|uniref:cystatin cpi-1-like n=1 Tax=Cotesia typhae TaxID=2053667 RepID=UPI003D68B5E7
MCKEYRMLFILFLALALRAAEARHSFVGGKESISVDDPEVKNAADTIMRQINREYRGERSLILVEIEEGKYQAVAGIKYYLRLRVGESNCRKNKLSPRCKLDESRPYKACSATILDQPWIHNTRIEWNCNPYENDDSNE